MTMEISELDRKLIKAAIEKQGITKVPMGKSGIPLPIWDGKKLVNQDPEEARSRWGRTNWLGGKGACSKTVARRAKVRLLHGEGLTCPEIAKRLKSDVRMIRDDHKYLKIEANAAPRGGKEKAAEVAKRRKSILRLAKKGVRNVDIQKKLDLPKHTVERDIKILRDTGKL